MLASRPLLEFGRLEYLEANGLTNDSCRTLDLLVNSFLTAVYALIQLFSSAKTESNGNRLTLLTKGGGSSSL